ncbi:hypothetical protein BGZ54_005296, partial [Gamsiella multidivaricata]
MDSRGASRGMKMNVKVWFRDISTIDKLKARKQKSVVVGRDLARIGRLGEEKVEWELRYVSKIHGLPFATTPLDLLTALNTLKVDFVEIPRYFARGTQVRYRSEGFVYFRTEEDMAKAMGQAFKIGHRELYWMGTNEKRCYQCNATSHGLAACPVRAEILENRAHQKKVLEFHAASPSKLRDGTTFASLLKDMGKTNSMPREKQQQKQQQSVVLGAGATFGMNTGMSMGMGMNPNFQETISGLLARQQHLEKSIADIQQTM